MFYNIYNINFELAAFAFVTILYFYLRRKYYDTTKVNINFRRLVFFQMVTIFFDLLTSFTISYVNYVPQFVNMILNTIYFASIGVTCYMFGNFFLAFTPKSKRKIRKFAKFFFKILLGVYLLVLVENIPTGICFSFKDGTYNHGPIYLISFILPTLYFVVSALLLFIMRFSIRKSTFVVLLFLFLLTLCGPIMQPLLFPNVLLGNFFSIYALVFCLFIIISPDYAQLMKKRAQLFELQKNLEQNVQDESEKSKRNEERIELFSVQIIEVLAKAINIGGANRENHSQNVGKISRLIAEEMGFEKSEIQKIYYAGVLHDIGTIGIDEDVVEKSGKYTEKEFDEMKTHSEIGSRIMHTITEMPGMDLIVRGHHERYDGNGYPDGLLGENIPIAARIIAVADAYDAMTHDRSYKETFSPQEAKDEIRRCSGTQFDPEVVAAFMQIAYKL